MSVVHTRIRPDACALNSHLLRIGIKQPPACSCGFINESKSHYFFYCPNYTAQTQTLLTSAACIAPNLWSRLSDRRKTELFIFGSSLLSDEQNCHIFYQVQYFIKILIVFPVDSVSQSCSHFVYFQRTSEPMHCTCTTFVDLGKYIFIKNI